MPLKKDCNKFIVTAWGAVYHKKICEDISIGGTMQNIRIQAGMTQGQVMGYKRSGSI